MAEEKKGMSNIIIAAIITGVIAIAFVGLQEGKKNDQNRIDNLPALEQKLESLSKQVENINNQFTALKTDMKEKDTLFQAQIDRRIERELQGQIDRRFDESQKEKDRRFTDTQAQIDRRFSDAKRESELVREDVKLLIDLIRNSSLQ